MKIKRILVPESSGPGRRQRTVNLFRVFLEGESGEEKKNEFSFTVTEDVRAIMQIPHVERIYYGSL